MHNNRFKGVSFFEDDSYTGSLKDASEFLTEDRNRGHRDEDIYLNI